MNRRRFIATTGCVSLGSLIGLKSSTKDALAVDFELITNKTYDYVESPVLYLSFENFYIESNSVIDKDKELEITVKSELKDSEKTDMVTRDSEKYDISEDGEISDILNNKPLEITGDENGTKLKDIIQDNIDEDNKNEINLIIRLQISWDNKLVKTDNKEFKITIDEKQSNIIDNFETDTTELYNNIGHGEVIFNVDPEKDSPTGNGVALVHAEDTDDDCAVSDSDGSFNPHPTSGDRIGWLVKTNGSTPGVAVHVDADGSGWTGYAYYVDGADSDLRVREYENHGSTDSAGDTLDSEEVDISIDEWYWVEAKYPEDVDNNLEMTIYEFDEDTLSRGAEIGSASATHREHISDETDGVIGFANIRDGGSPGEIDWLRILE